MMWHIFTYGTVSAYTGLPGMMADGENCGTYRKTMEDCRAGWGTTGVRLMVVEGGGRHNVLHPGYWLLLVGQVQKMTKQDNTISTALILGLHGHTALLLTLVDVS